MTCLKKATDSFRFSSPTRRTIRECVSSRCDNGRARCCWRLIERKPGFLTKCAPFWHVVRRLGLLLLATMRAMAATQDGSDPDYNLSLCYLQSHGVILWSYFSFNLPSPVPGTLNYMECSWLNGRTMEATPAHSVLSFPHSFPQSRTAASFTSLSLSFTFFVSYLSVLRSDQSLLLITTTSHIPLITHHSSYTTHHTPSSHTTHLTLLITHHSSHTTHHTSLISLTFIVQDLSVFFSSQSLLLVASSDKLNMWGYPVLLFSFKVCLRLVLVFASS